MEWKYSKEDQEIVFLIKTMNKKHLKQTVENGTFCFNFPSVFNSSPNLSVAQYDQWDSHLSYEAIGLRFAPIVSKDENGIHYGTPVEIADEAKVHSISSTSKQTPLCSFRKVEKTDLMQRGETTLFRLGNVVDRIKNEFGHDAFILVHHPHVLIKRISAVSPCFARSIHYGKIDGNFQAFLDERDFEQKEMFQKSEEYAWQKEFRVIITPRDASGPQIIEIGSIEDIAVGGDIELLRQGYIIAETEEQLKKAIENRILNGDAYDQL